jgi:hypothetical protein
MVWFDVIFEGSKARARGKETSSMPSSPNERDEEKKDDKVTEALEPPRKRVKIHENGIIHVEERE